MGVPTGLRVWFGDNVAEISVGSAVLSGVLAYGWHREVPLEGVRCPTKTILLTTAALNAEVHSTGFSPEYI